MGWQVTILSGLTFAELDGQLLARCDRAADRPPLEADAVRSALADAGYADWALRDEALAALLQRWQDEDEAFELVLGQREDGRFAIELAPDASQAWVSVTPARGGQPVEVEDLVLELAAAGVVHGVDRAALQQACASPQTARVLAALGSLPQRGEDTRFEVLVADTRDRTPKVDEHGLIDFHELGDIPIVKAGQALMRRHPPTPGVDGRNVRGAMLPAVAGLDIPFGSPLVGAAPADDDPQLLRALCSGQPVRSATAVMVEQVLRLKEVGMATGNIQFDGTVEIDGDVQPGMKVKATGDIVVKGIVEGAQLDAGGSVRVQGGIIARAVVRAGQHISARFVETASLQAQATIAIDDMAVHGDLQALHEILVGIKSPKRGKLVGGSARAMMLVRAPVLGASAGGLTKVQVGVNPALDARLQELNALIETQKADEDKLDKVLKHLKQHGDPRGMLERVTAARKQALDAWGASLAEKGELDAQLALAAAARIEIGVEVGGDVDLQFGKLLRRVRRHFGAGAFGLDEAGEAIFTDAAGTVTRID